MPRQRIYEDDNARQRACRERKAAREAEAARLAALERARVQEMQRVTRQAFVQAVQREVKQRGAARFLGWDQVDQEAAQYLNTLVLSLAYRLG